MDVRKMYVVPQLRMTAVVGDASVKMYYDEIVISDAILRTVNLEMTLLLLVDNFDNASNRSEIR